MKKFELLYKKYNFFFLADTYSSPTPAKTSNFTENKYHNIRTKKPHSRTQMSDLPIEISPLLKEKILKPSETQIGHQMPKLLGKLVVSAVLGLVALANEVKSMNVNSKDFLNPATTTLLPAKLSPYSAIVYETFPLFSQEYFYSHLLELLSPHIPQKLYPETNDHLAPNVENPRHKPVFIATGEAGHEVKNKDFPGEQYITAKKEYNNVNEANINGEKKVNVDV